MASVGSAWKAKPGSFTQALTAGLLQAIQEKESQIDLSALLTSMEQNRSDILANMEHDKSEMREDLYQMQAWNRWCFDEETPGFDMWVCVCLGGPRMVVSFLLPYCSLT